MGFHAVGDKNKQDPWAKKPNPAHQARTNRRRRAVASLKPPPPRPDTPNVDQSDPVDATIELSSDRKCSIIFVQLLLLIPQYDLPLQNVQELLLPVNLLVGRDGAPLKITA